MDQAWPGDPGVSRCRTRSPARLPDPERFGECLAAAGEGAGAGAGAEPADHQAERSHSTGT